MSEITSTYKTILQPTTALFKERGSKFLAFSFPVKSIKEVKEHLKRLRKEHIKANHHCFAFRIGIDGLSFRTNDDGEPSGSAGKPILGQIDSAGMTDILVVVVRYFGGTLLGIPGLINAYKTVAMDCLAVAEVVKKNVEFNVVLEFNYPLMNEVMQLLKQYEVSIYHQEMLLFCKFVVGIPLIHKEACLSCLQKIRDLEIKTTDPFGTDI